MDNETDNPKQVMSLGLEESDPTTASAAGRVPRVSFDAASIAGNPARIDDPVRVYVGHISSLSTCTTTAHNTVRYTLHYRQVEVDQSSVPGYIGYQVFQNDSFIHK